MIREGDTIILSSFDHIKTKSGFLYNDLLTGNFIGPLTACFRRKLIRYIDFGFMLDNNISSVDYMFWLEMSIHSKFAYISEPTAVYRRLQNSLSNTSDFNKKEKFLFSSFLVIDYFLKKYPTEDSHKIRRISYNKLYLTLLVSAFRNGNPGKVREYSLKLEPGNLKETIIAAFFSRLLFIRLLRFLKVSIG